MTWLWQPLKPSSAAANDITASGTLSITGAADLDAIGQLVAAGSLSINGIADLDAIGQLLAVGSLAISGAAALTAPGGTPIIWAIGWRDKR